jgi:hypothetical protein
MPRLAIRLEVVDDENHTIHVQHWSPLGYEDFNNPVLLQADPDGAAVSRFELNLLERLRVAIDRSLMRFAHGERRRNAPPATSIQTTHVDFAGPYDDIEAIPNPNLFAGLTPQQQEQFNQLRVDPVALARIRESVEVDRLALIQEQGLKEDEPLRKPEPTPVARKNRYERNPVI